MFCSNSKHPQGRVVVIDIASPSESQKKGLVLFVRCNQQNKYDYYFSNDLSDNKNHEQYYAIAKKSKY